MKHKEVRIKIFEDDTAEVSFNGLTFRNVRLGQPFPECDDEDDLAERIADGVIQKLKDEKAEEERCKRELEFLNLFDTVVCDELPETGAPNCIYYCRGKEYIWFDAEWERIR